MYKRQAVHNDKELKLGAPYVKGATVNAKVLKNGKGKKITVFTYRPKKGSQRKMGPVSYTHLVRKQCI